MQYNRRLPHIDLPGAAFMVTFRLENSINAKVAEALKEERELGLSQICIIEGGVSWEEQKRRVDFAYFKKYDHLLDHPTYGDRYLSEFQITEILKEVIHEYDGLYYKLGAYCIMSNHVHLLFDTGIQLPSDGSDLSDGEYLYVKDIVGRIKGKSAFLINKFRNQSGSIWESESFERYIRNEKHYGFSKQYILNNPIKANLVQNWEEWNGTWRRDNANL